MSWASANKHLKLHYGELYNSLPAAMSQPIIKKTGDDFSIFINANKAYAVARENSGPSLKIAKI